MFEIFDPMDKSRTVIHRTRSEFHARLFVTVANHGRREAGLRLLDYAHESEPWL